MQLEVGESLINPSEDKWTNKTISIHPSFVREHNFCLPFLLIAKHMLKWFPAVGCLCWTEACRSHWSFPLVNNLVFHQAENTWMQNCRLWTKRFCSQPRISGNNSGLKLKKTKQPTLKEILDSPSLRHPLETNSFFSNKVHRTTSKMQHHRWSTICASKVFSSKPENIQEKNKCWLCHREAQVLSCESIKTSTTFLYFQYKLLFPNFQWKTFILNGRLSWSAKPNLQPQYFKWRLLFS